jgi:excisionase family DNA binding protein
MEQTNGARRLLRTRSEAARYLSLSESTIDVLIAHGLIACRKMGRKRLIPHAALVAFSHKNHSRLWPPKVGGKTTRHAHPPGQSSIPKPPPPATLNFVGEIAVEAAA